MGRQEDKQQLAALNDKFAYYTSKVMLMEADAYAMDAKLRVLTEFRQGGSAGIRIVLDQRIEEAQDTLRKVNRERMDSERKANESEILYNRMEGPVAVVSEPVGPDPRLEDLERRITELGIRIIDRRQRVNEKQLKVRGLKDQYHLLLNKDANDLKQQQDTILKATACDGNMRMRDIEYKDLLMQFDVEYNTLSSKHTLVRDHLNYPKLVEDHLMAMISEKRMEYDLKIEQNRSKIYFGYVRKLYTYIIERTLKLRTSSVDIHIWDKLLAHKQIELLEVKQEVALLSKHNEFLRQRMEQVRRPVGRMTVVQQLDIEIKQLNIEYEQLVATNTQLTDELRRYEQLLDGQNGLKEALDRARQNRQHGITWNSDIDTTFLNLIP
ncbi:unnamed protein product, partial [Didymodactylos carnosus]